MKSQSQFSVHFFPGANVQAVKAARRMVKAISPHHSITSRRHSLSALMKYELDGAIECVVRRYRDDTGGTALIGFRLSRAWQSSPDGARASGCAHAVDVARCHAGRWRTLIKEEIRRAQRKAGLAASGAVDEYCSTLDLVIMLIDRLSDLAPASTHMKSQDEARHGRRISLVARAPRQHLCELCWRPTMFRTLGDQRDPEHKPLGASHRFCSEHCPNQKSRLATSAAASNYRRDLKSRGAFEAEVKFLYENWASIRSLLGPLAIMPDTREPSGYQIHLIPVTPDAQDVRRAAYATIHCKLWGTGAQSWILQRDGHSAASIAERLNLQDRGIRAAMAAFRVKLEHAEKIRLRFDGYD